MSALKDIQTRLRKSLARTTALQQLVGGNEAETLARIHFNELPPPANKARYTRAELDQYRPYVVLWAALDNALRSQSEAAFGYHLQSGVVEALVVKGLSNSELNDGNTAIIANFDDIIGRIAQSNDNANPGLMELLQADPGANFNFNDHETKGAQLGDKTEEQEIGAEVVALLRFQWGVQSSE